MFGAYLFPCFLSFFLNNHIIVNGFNFDCGTDKAKPSYFVVQAVPDLAALGGYLIAMEFPGHQQLSILPPGRGESKHGKTEKGHADKCLHCPPHK